ncbi:MAG: metal ABC transporter ATP-binding protein [Simkaniaceae bacterium]|nr:metal ABC transporter ATP-binding protein [Simkaniaceae bacterium]
MSVLKVKDLTIRYDKNPAIWNVCCSIPAGERVAIVGPNGAGKTTFLKGLLGFVPCVSGEVTFFGKDLDGVRHRVAYVPQKEEIDWDFPITVFDVVKMGLHRMKRFGSKVRRAAKARVMEALEKVGMEDFAGRQLSDLSGGQQQRVFLARAILQDADLYLLDEPLMGIDHTTEQTIIELFAEWKAQGKTVVAVHHNLDTLPAIYDWAVLLNVGLIGAGPVDTVCTEENLTKAYGKNVALLTELAHLSAEKLRGRP